MTRMSASRPPASLYARKEAHTMFYADAHCDTLYALANIENDGDPRAPETLDITVEKLRQTGDYMQTLAMFATHNGMEGDGYNNCLRMLSEAEKLDIKLFRGELPELPPSGPSAILSIEGGEALQGRLDRFEEFADAGVRMIALTWNHENEIGVPAAKSATGGLTEFGKRLIGRMNERGVLCDVSHLNEAGFWDVMELSAMPPVASHSCVRSLCNHTRNLWNDQIRAIIERNGFIGVNFYPRFLSENDPAQVSVNDVVEHIDYIAQLGGIDCVGFGSDFDGIELHPTDLHGPQDVPRIIEALRKRGYPEDSLAAIAGYNFYRVLSDTLTQ